MSADAAAPEIVVRPSRRSLRTALIGVVAVILLFGGIAAVAQGPLAGLAAAGLVAAVCLPVAALMLAHHHRAGVVGTSTEIVVAGLAKRRRWARTDVAHLVHAMLVAPRTPVYGNLFILDRDGNRIARIHTNHYRASDLERLVQYLGLPVVAPDGPVTANQLATSYPGIVWFGERRPFTFAMLCAVVFTTVLITVLVIFG